MPTGEDSIAKLNAIIITKKLNAMNKSPIANLNGKDGSKFFRAN